jgi:hypothetical protein
MNANPRQYVFGLIFIGVGIYNIVIRDYLESSLYIMAGLSFIFNQLANEARFVAYKKPLVITTWALIIITGLLFLYLLQFKFL